MNNKNLKVVDQNNIDRAANVIFAIDLEGSEYVVYWIERDDDENNLFVSKLIKNTDGTSNLLDVENENEKNKVSDVAKRLIARSVKDESDKLDKDSVLLDDGTLVKLVAVSFNKEQRINVQKTYITTVKKEVTKVAETYFDVLVASEVSNVVEDIFPTITPVVPAAPVVEPTPVVVEPVTPAVTPVVSETPAVVIPEPVVIPQPAVVEPITTPVVPEPVVAPAASVVEPTPVVVEPVTPAVTPVVPETPAVVMPEPVPVAPEPAQTLVFNASKETNLNAALGEVVKDETIIPVDNIEPIREFGVEEPVKPAVPEPTAPAVAPTAIPTPAASESTPVSPKAGFANSKFFMVVAVAFFLASCVFLGYEVFNYFQITK